MPSILPGFEYDIFISYRQKDNIYDVWVTEFVTNLKKELEATFKEDISIYFDTNPHDGLLETHHVEKSIEGKLKCLIFIPIISKTYCDTESFAWNNEFLAFINLARSDQYTLHVRLATGNIASRILPIRIHDLDPVDQAIFENETGSALRAIDFIFRTDGVNRPLRSKDDDVKEMPHPLLYRNQINKVANAIKELINGLSKNNPGIEISSHARLHTPETDIQRNNSPRKKVVVAMIVLLAAVLFLILSNKLFQANEIAKQKTIAVLAFTDMSPDHNQEWFADGISEEIINSIANLSELKVTARTSSFYFKDKNVPIAEIAKTLGVDHILEGSVRRIGDQLKITVQLIRAQDEFHVWSQTFDRSAVNLFEIQGNIANAVSEKLLTNLTHEQSQKIKPVIPSSVEAYEYYLRGVNTHINSYTITNFDKDFIQAQKLLLRSISLDPNYSPSYAALADLYDSRGNNALYRTEFWRLRDSIALVGYKVNPNSASILLIRALTFRKSEATNLDSSFHYLRQAYALKPSDSYVNLLAGHFYFQIGLYEVGRKYLYKSLEIDPLSLSARTNLAMGQIIMGDFDGAEIEFVKIAELDSLGGHIGLALINIYKRKLRKASAELTLADERTGLVSLKHKALLLAAQGKRDEALKVSRDIQVLMFLGMKKESLEQLDTLTLKSIPIIEGKVSNILFSLDALDRSPLWDFVRNESEFNRIHERVKRDYDQKLRKYGVLN